MIMGHYAGSRGAAPEESLPSHSPRPLSWHLSEAPPLLTLASLSALSLLLRATPLSGWCGVDARWVKMRAIQNDKGLRKRWESTGGHLLDLFHYLVSLSLEAFVRSLSCQPHRCRCTNQYRQYSFVSHLYIAGEGVSVPSCACGGKNDGKCHH